MSDPDEALRRALATAATTSSPCQRVLRYHDDREVATRPMDFYQALKTVDPLVVRLTDANVPDLPTTADYHWNDGLLDYQTPSGPCDPGFTGRDNFTDAIRDADSVDLLAHSDSWFMTDDATSRGGIPDCDRCDDGGDVIEAPEAGYWTCTSCGARGSGTSEPIWWHNDPDSIWHDESDEDVRADGGRSLSEAVFAAIRKHARDDRGAPIDAVINTLDDSRPETRERIRQKVTHMAQQGDIYRPNCLSVKPTDRDRLNDSGGGE